MPRRDGTGPMGAGPKTGRGFGPCAWPAGKQGRGMGFGRGYGRGYGWYAGFCPFAGKVTQKEELEILEDQANFLEEDLKGIKTRISELKTQK